MANGPKLSDKYQKIAEDETFLDHFNSILKPYQEEEYQDLLDGPPTVHVVGTPRSGTTLLTQLLAAHLDVGHINNLIARFWRAPLYGIRLSRMVLPKKRKWNFESEFGLTLQIDEPHEFGYFWYELLGYTELIPQSKEFEDNIDWNRVRKLVNNVAATFGCPVVFKTILLAWHMARVQQVLPRTIFVRVRRNPVLNALSVLKFRRAFYNTIDHWVSYKPKEYEWLKEESPWKQVVGQIFYLERSMTEQIEKIQGRNVIETTYEEVCARPMDVLERVQQTLRDNDWDTEILSEPPAVFEPKTNYQDSPDYKKIQDAVHEFYGEEVAAQ